MGLTKGRKRPFAKEPQHKNKWLTTDKSKNKPVVSSIGAYKKT